ncbi:hypothetical protein, partial [Pseudomonas sp. MD195_PC81_125]|uniref:hypothetical protein n=1 Tax=Pseudomonas sp. MD195_PC81_125 TaxID=2741560 RepID=UPI001C70F86B
MTANSTEADTDRAIPLDKLSSRVGDQTGRAGYVVFVLNIGRVLNISHILKISTKPVGASLLAKAVCQTTQMLNVPASSR